MPVMPMSAVLHEAGPWIERLARFGYAVKGVLYMLIGALAASFALGNGGRPDVDSHGAFDKVLHAPFGRVLLGAIAVGLLGYSIWLLVNGIKGVDHPGHKPKAVVLRTAAVVRAVIHLALAGAAASLALWQRGGGGHDESAKHWTARALELPAGQYVVYGVAGAFIAYGAHQLYRAVTAKLDKRLDLSHLRTGRNLVIGVSRMGIAARGVVFGTIGVMLGRAAMDRAPAKAGGTKSSLGELSELGQLPFLAIALGLAAYGIYELLHAKYRRINTR
jgi:hypothetical protein